MGVAPPGTTPTLLLHPHPAVGQSVVEDLTRDSSALQQGGGGGEGRDGVQRDLGLALAPPDAGQQGTGVVTESPAHQNAARRGTERGALMQGRGRGRRLLVERGVMVVRHQLVTEVDGFHGGAGEEAVAAQDGGEGFSEVVVEGVDDGVER